MGAKYIIILTIKGYSLVQLHYVPLSASGED